MNRSREWLIFPLPWPMTVLLLSLSFFPIAWVCAASGNGKNMDDIPGMVAALFLLMGLEP